MIFIPTEDPPYSWCSKCYQALLIRGTFVALLHWGNIRRATSAKPLARVFGRRIVAAKSITRLTVWRTLRPAATGSDFTKTSASNPKAGNYGFTISYRKEGARQYELKAETEAECNNWVHAIDCASFSKMLLQKEELEQKHLHLVQIVESEKTAKWQYTQQCEELTVEIKKLRAEVQSFFRGWLCRRRWKQIVAEYISSPHAENMRKRNSLVFRMVEAEEEYVEQLQLLVSCFLRPFKMAASSQKPPCTHDEVNSIFLNRRVHACIFKAAMCFNRGGCFLSLWPERHTLNVVHLQFR
ncbi:hypothetical protein MTO96_000122 [Rhipicephalus appendiculatus]